MFGQGHDDSIVQRGIDEALACRDMLAPAPAEPSPLARLHARIIALLRAIFPTPHPAREDRRTALPPAAELMR